MNSRAALSFAALAILGLVAAHPAAAQSTVTQLTGGDAGEGFAPLAHEYAGLSTYYNQGVVQGISFANANGPQNSPKINVYYGNQAGTGGSGTYFSGTSANDIALDGILSHGTYAYGAFYVEIHGLTVGQTYQVDSFAATQGYGGRTETVTAHDKNNNPIYSSTHLLSLGTTANPGGAYDFVDTLKPDAAGTIYLTYTAANDNPYPLLSSVAVTYNSPAAAPEPSQLAGLGFAAFGALGLVWKARKRKAGEAVA